MRGGILAAYHQGRIVRIGMGYSRDGLYSCKSKFNPEINQFAVSWDLPLNELKYKVWRTVGERAAARLANRRPEKFLYRIEIGPENQPQMLGGSRVRICLRLRTYQLRNADTSAASS